MNPISSIKLWTVDTLFPRHCVGCGKADVILCDDCRAKIILVKKQQCGRCFRISQFGKTCPKCREHWPLDNLLVGAYYDGPLKELLHCYKYESRRELAEVINEILTSNQSVSQSLARILKVENDSLCLDSCLRRNDKADKKRPDNKVVVIPVPLHRRRLWWRGFNQAEGMARMIALQHNLTFKPSTLYRRRYTHPQVALSRRDRLHNLDKIFACPTNSLIGCKTVILVDDIATTGATLNACAATLKKAGVKRVIGVTVGRAR